MYRRTLSVLLFAAGLMGPAVSHSQTVTDPGFEAPAQGPGRFNYRPAGGAWSFSGYSGLSGNGSPFTSGNPAAPEGGQVAYLQNDSLVAQIVTAWPSGAWTISLSAAQRNYLTSRQRVVIQVDGATVGTITPTGTSYQTYQTDAFVVPAGNHTLTLKTTAVGGADYTVFIDAIAINAAPLPAPKVTIADLWIGTSGKVLGLRLQGPDPAVVPQPISLLTPPVLYRNGMALGPLGPAADLAQNEVVLYPLAPGDQIAANDLVTLTAPPGWLNTTAGLVANLNGASVDNRTGRSPLPASARPAKVVTPGVNCNLGAAAFWGNYWPLKNWAYKVGWPGGNLGKIRGVGTLPVYTNNGYNGVDATGYPGPAGLWLVYYRPTGPTPASFSLTTADAAGTAVTERADLANPKAPGGYVGRVFDFEHVPGSTTANIDVQLAFNDPTSTAAFEDLWVVGPGDFDCAANTPVVFDTSDPFAASRTFAQWTEGAGSLRWVDSSNCGGNPSSCPYPELLLRATDKNWGDLGFRSVRYGFTSIGPVDTTATPWMYSAKFPPFGATLATDITTTPAVGTVETYTFSDAATAPLMAGLEVKLDNEVCRILSVAGNAVQLYRGSNGTTPATHSAGAVQVSGRKPLAIPATGIVPGGYTYQLTTDRPHGITTMHGFTTYGTWPQIAWSDGETTGRLDARYSLVTGPNTIVSFIGPTSKPEGAKPVQTYPLDPAQCYSEMRYGSYIPPEVTAMVTAKMPGAALHVNINMDASDDLVWTLLRWAHDLMPPGREVIVEYMNEPWNWAFTGFGYVTQGAQYFGTGNPYQLSYYCQRAGEVGAIGRQVFADRPGDFKLMLNCQLGSDQAKAHLAYAAKNGWQIDRIGIAPYLNIDTAAKALATWDDDQLCDLWIHFLWNSRATGGMAYNAYASQVQGYIRDYNAATGGNCKLMAYEGGIETPLPNLARSLDLVYNPNWYWFEDTFYAWLDRWQFAEAHVYSLSQYHSPQMWGLYHWPRQRPGYGDGRGGGTDNRKRLARPGQPNSKAPGVNVDLNDSVRGQAFRDRLRKAG